MVKTVATTTVVGVDDGRSYNAEGVGGEGREGVGGGGGEGVGGDKNSGQKVAAKCARK